MSLLKFEFLKNAEMKRVVPVNGVKIVDKNGYIGADMTEYFPHQPYMNYVNYALVLNGPNYSKTGLGQVEFIDSEYLANIGGRDYKTCIIGGMVWMAENLDMRWDGLVVGSSASTTEQRANYYNNDEGHYGINGTYKCGLLYNRIAMRYLHDNRETLISGWHVPSSSEWSTLLSYANARQLSAIDNTVTPSWPSSWGGTDNFGFSALPGGYRSNSSYLDVNTKAWFWTCTNRDGGNASYFRSIDGKNNSSDTAAYDSTAYTQYNIRLVKDVT